MSERDILNIDEAAELLGVSIKTFNKVLHQENMPARKIGREWKFSRRALIDWVGAGRARDFYKDGAEVRDDELHEHELTPKQKNGMSGKTNDAEKPRARRTAGWQIED